MIPIRFSTPRQKIILTRDMTFLQKSNGEYNKVEKPVLVTASYEGLDDENKVKMVPIISNNNNSNVVSDSNRDDDTKSENKNVFDKDVNNEVKVVQAMKKLQASYNDNANKIIKQAMQEKNAIENLNVLINLAMVASNTKPTPEEPQTFNEAWNNPNEDSCKNVKK